MENVEIRYLRSWDYNVTLIMEELEKIVLNNGGAIVSTWKTERKQYLIENRTLSDEIRKHREHVKRMEALNRPGSAAEREKLERLESIDNTPVLTNYYSFGGVYINFVLDGVYYYYSIDDNPFFDFHYDKIPVINGAIDQDHYTNTCKKEWLYDCFFCFDCSHADRMEAANMIFNMLMNAQFSRKYKGNRKPARLNILAGNIEV